MWHGKNSFMKLAIIGDFRKENKTHVATNSAINHSLTQIGAPLDVEWVHTSTIPARLDKLANAFLIAPGSPYADMTAALSVIKFSREPR